MRAAPLAPLGRSFADSVTELGRRHSDWPYNQSNAGHVRQPYPAHPAPPMHITTLWMLTAFTEETGGTLTVPNR